MRSTKRTNSPSFDPKFLEEHLERVSSGDRTGEGFSESDIREIGCRSFRLHSRQVKVVKWQDKGSSCVVVSDAKRSVYKYPFHTSIYQPFINFEVTDDIDYVERYANGHRLDGRIGVRGDEVVAIGDRYLGDERFTMKVPDFKKKEKFFV